MEITVLIYLCSWFKLTVMKIKILNNKNFKKTLVKGTLVWLLFFTTVTL